ncbi:tail fiber domain-containing protein [Carnobacterium sp.]|uniref:tail fiber domain-containing protein n=1 Tax=Carnobacterium sp. TaxID=48221 RepID=UPI003890BB46
MLYLYPKNTVDFTNNGNPIRYSFDEHVVRDEGFYLSFNLLLDKEEDYKKIKKEMIISADTPDGINQFRIYDIKNKSTTVEVTAVQLMYDFDNKEINPFSLKNATGSQVISRFESSFKSTLGQFTMDSSVTETHDFTTNDEDDDIPSHNALEILNRITDRWDSELMLNGFDIRMIKRLGAKTDALLYEKKNISEFEDASSVSGMITRIHATSKFTPEGKEDEVILSVTVDSPLISEYAQIYEKSYVNNDCRTEAELIAWTKLKYSTENVDKPSRSITVSTNIIDGTEINYGDDLVLKYLVHDVDEIIRCVGYDYDPIKNIYYSVTLGDWKDSFLNTVTSNIIDNTNKQLNQMKNSVTYIAMSANGKNRNAYGPDPVPNPINGDNWYYYEFDRPNDVELRIFQDGFWVVIDFAMKKEVEAVLDQADLDRAKAEQDISQALLDAKNYTETKAREFDNQLLIVNQNLVTATDSADAAVQKADKAIEDVGFMKIDVTTTKQTAIDALTQAQTATNNVSTLSFNIDELTKTVGFKAEKTVVDAVTKKVDQHTLDITANAQAISARLTSAQVDSLVTGKGYVNQAQLTATSSQWNLALTQVSTDLSNVNVGDRNLVLASNKPVKPGTGYNFANYTLSENWSVGSEYTVVIKADFKAGKDIGVYYNGGTSVFKRIQYDVVKGVYIGTGTVTTANLGSTTVLNKVYLFQFPNDSFALNVEWIKIVKGNKASADWTPAPEDLTTLEQFTTLDIKVNGIQTTVGNKAEQSQVTQLAGQITTKVESSTYNSKMTQLDSAINLRVVQGDVTAAILADKTIKDTRATNETPLWYFTNYPKQTVEEFKQRTTMGVTGSSTYGQLTTKVLWNSTSGGSITQAFSSSDGVFQRQSVSGSSAAWGNWDKVAEAGKLVAQINLSSEGVLIQGKRIQLDGDVAMNAAFVTRLDVLALSAVYADIATLKARVLTANVITADMLQTNVSIINKLFATDTMVTTLTAKTSFINSVKAIDIAADRITTGNLNAANVNIINLNVSKIVGLNSSFIQSNWNAAAGGGVSIAGGGVVTTASDGAQTLLQNGVLYVKSKSGQGLGTIGAALDGNENLFSIDIVNNQSFTIRYQTATGSSTYKDIIGYYDYLGTVVINNATQINGWLRMNGALDMQQSDILAARYITAGVLQTGTIGSILNDGNRIAAKGISGVSLGVGGQVNGGFSRIFWLDGTTIYAEKNLSMQKNTITNQSDKRLKKNIITSSRNAMDSIRNWNFVDYEWIDNEQNKDVQFGLIAQDTPELMTYGEEHDFYSIDTGRQIMLNSKVGQELVLRTDKHETKFTELEGKYELLKQKIEKLESEQ